MSLVSNKEETYTWRLAEWDTEIMNLKHWLKTLTLEFDDMKKFESIWNADNERLIRDLETLTWEN